MTDNSGEYWGGTTLIHECLTDTKRVRAFRRAINDAVKPGDIVIDAGSGSGILAMFAVDAGAKVVYAIEDDRDVLPGLMQTIKNNGYGKKISVLAGDAVKVKVPEQADVLISEVIGTGLIEEDQVPIVKHLSQYLKSGAVVVPALLEHFIELGSARWDWYRKRILSPYYQYEDRQFTPAADRVLYSRTDLSKPRSLPHIIEASETVTINITSDVNALRISTQTHFPNGTALGSTTAYCSPLILPLKPLSVAKGVRLCVSLKYLPACGIGRVSYKVNPLPTG